MTPAADWHPYARDGNYPDECRLCALPAGNRRHHPPPPPTVAQARALITAQAGAAIRTEDRRAIDTALADLARAGRSFSANELRPLLPDDTPGSAVGPRFTAAHSRGLIEPTGRYVMSTDPATRHRLTEWRGTPDPRSPTP